MIVVSPRDERLYARVEPGNNGVSVSFWRGTPWRVRRYTKRGMDTLLETYTFELPFHVVLDGVHSLLTSN